MRSRPEARRKNAGRLLRTTRARVREARAAPSDPQDRRLRPGGCRASGLLGTTERVENGRTRGRRGTRDHPRSRRLASPLRRPASSPHLRLRLRRRIRHGPPARRVINEPRNNAAGLIDLVAVLDPPPPRRLAMAGGTPRAQPVPHPPVQAELGLLLLLPTFPAGLHCFPRLIPQTPERPPRTTRGRRSRSRRPRRGLRAQSEGASAKVVVLIDTSLATP